METKPIWEVIDAIRGSEGLHAKCQLFGILLKREGPNYDVNGLTGETSYLSQIKIFFDLLCLVNAFSFFLNLFLKSG